MVSALMVSVSIPGGTLLEPRRERAPFLVTLARVPPRNHFRVRSAGVAALAAAAALAVAACGDDGGDSGEPVDKSELGAAFAAAQLQEIQSGAVDFTMGFDVEGEEGEDASAAVEVSGVFDEGAAEVSLSVDAEGEGSENTDIGARFVTTGSETYITFEDDTYAVPPELAERWRRLNASGPSGQAAADFAEQCRRSVAPTGGDASICEDIDPAAWLGEVTDEGSEDVDGTEATHLHAGVDVDRMLVDFMEIGLATLPPEQRNSIPIDPEEIGEQVADYIDEGNLDVFVGDDGILRRASFDLGIEGDGVKASVDMQLDVTEVNEPQEVVPVAGNALPLASLRDRLPAEFVPVFDCLLAAKTLPELNRCSFVAAGTGTPVNAAPAPVLG
jgi:hypothetical protein